ncbi:MAG: hypothetical protein NTX01_00590 [Candidatus Omnitrophica bacterium]|nr:hypothetical protein [Candidatus Omnitrophota bacterium]
MVDLTRLQKERLERIKSAMDRAEKRFAVMRRLGFTRIQMDRMEKAWIEFVDRIKAELFLTVTFRKATNRKLALKRLKHFFRYLNKPDIIFFQKYILCWVCFEETVEGLHLHILIRGVAPRLASFLQRECCIRFGNSNVKVFNYSGLPYTFVNYVVEKHIYTDFDRLESFKINSRWRKPLQFKGSIYARPISPNPPLNQLAVV